MPSSRAFGLVHERHRHDGNLIRGARFMTCVASPSAISKHKTTPGENQSCFRAEVFVLAAITANAAPITLAFRAETRTFDSGSFAAAQKAGKPILVAIQSTRPQSAVRRRCIFGA
jgi:hypothetical protein